MKPFVNKVSNLLNVSSLIKIVKYTPLAGEQRMKRKLAAAAVAVVS